LFNLGREENVSEMTGLANAKFRNAEDDPDVLEELTYLEPLGKSDHVCISWKFGFTTNQPIPEPKYNF